MDRQPSHTHTHKNKKVTKNTNKNRTVRHMSKKVQKTLKAGYALLQATSQDTRCANDPSRNWLSEVG